ncbi:nucleostemin 1 isoform X2 [Lycorma delicatula]
MIVVPNICPFKEEILKEVAEAKERQELERKKKKDLLKAEKEARKAAERKSTLEGLMEDAKMKENLHKNFDKGSDNEELKKFENKKNSSTKAFYKEFKKVVEAADVILQVVDARDPQGTRCDQVEQSIRESGKKRLIIVVNKADLVPREILDRWLKYLRRSFPTVAFKASTQSQSNRLGRQKLKRHAPKEALQVSQCVGAELLMSLLANYCRNKGIKTSITVGVVGLPNVGKSSIINSLKRSRACQVGGTPGVTRCMQEVQLDKKIKLLDSPGVVLASGGDTNDVLKNATKVEQLNDPISAATTILMRATKQQMMELYDIGEYDSPTDFFAIKAKRQGRFKRGGLLDIESSARSMIEDWNQGKIRYYTEPPEEKENIHISSAIVEQEAAEFDLDKAQYETMEIEVLDSLQNVQSEDKIELPMDEDNPNSNVTVDTTATLTQKAKKRRKNKESDSGKKNEQEENLSFKPENLKLKRLQKVNAKKLRKLKARQERNTSVLTNVIEKLSL